MSPQIAAISYSDETLCRSQPHFYAEIHRYGLHSLIKTSNGTYAPEQFFYKPAEGPVCEVPSEELYNGIQAFADEFFGIDGLSSRELMPNPHEPLREGSLWTKYDHLSVRDRLNQIDAPSSVKDYFETLVNPIGSAPGTDISFVEPLRWYALGGHSIKGMFETTQAYKLGGRGQSLLARNMLSEFRGHIKLQTPVTRIEQTSATGGATVTTESGHTFHATTAVVCTIPLNVLKTITFSPPLSPLRQQAIEQGHMNDGGKVHFKLRGRVPAFTAMANGYGTAPFCLVFSDHYGTASATGDEGSGTYCIGFSYKDLLRPAEIVEAFNRDVKPGAVVEGYLSHDWIRDPYSRGTWSCWGPGDMGRYLAELQKDDGCVVMASSDWADGWRGFIDGALERGKVAARRVMQRLKDAGKSVDVEGREADDREAVNVVARL